MAMLPALGQFSACVRAVPAWLIAVLVRLLRLLRLLQALQRPG